MSDELELGRRAFLRRLLALPAAGVALSLAGCAAQATTPVPTPTAPAPAPTLTPLQAAPTPTEAPSAMPRLAATAAPTQNATAVPTSLPVTATLVPTATPQAAYLAVVRGQAPGPADLTRRAIAAVGGIERFVHKGADVIVKPNICNAYRGPEYASTTNPEVVGAIVALCLGAGARRVRVMDFPFDGAPQDAYQVSGIAQAVEAAGGQMELMNDLKYQAVEIPNALRLKRTQVYADILKADALINVPIAKQHSAATLTLGLKNLMGAIKGRTEMHYYGLDECIADLATVVKPQLTVIDAVRILVANGPTGGNLADVRQTNTVIASADVVAADAYAATLFGMTGADIGYIAMADKLGVGKMDLKSIQIAQLNA